MSKVLVADVGTTNIKAAVVDPAGKVPARRTRPVRVHRPEPGAAEHDPEELFEGFCGVVREAAEGNADQISALCLSGYQFGFLPLDEEDRPLGGFITLLDSRSRGALEPAVERVGAERIFSLSGFAPMFTSLLAKALWLRRERPETRRRLRRFADVKSFIIGRLTGTFATEPSTAASTQLLNVEERRWEPELLSAAGLAEDQLPRLVPPGEVLGQLPPESARRLGLGREVALVPGLYDGGGLVLGMGGLQGTAGICNLGTTAMLRACVSSPVLDSPPLRRLQTWPLTEGTWAIGGGVNNAGVVLEWFRDELAPGESYEQVLEEAAGAESEGLLCLPFLTGERDPRIGERACCAFLGLRPHHGRGEMARAVLEGVAYTVRLIQEALAENDIEPGRLRAGGSGSSSDLWLSIMADTCGLPVRRSRAADPGLIGQAMLALTATGRYADLAEAAGRMVHLGEEFGPDPERVRRRAEGFRSFRRAVEALRPLYGGASAQCDPER